MLVAPLAVGAVAAGPSWRHLALLVAWVVGYLGYQATALWLKSGRRPRYLPPVRAYVPVAALAAAGVVASRPDLIGWAAVLGPLLLAGLVLSARRRDRTVAYDVVTVTAACLAPVLAFGVEGIGPRWLPGAGAGAAWALAAVWWAYFVGTAPYVRSMIRERGNPAVYRASVAYHVAATVAVAVLASVAGELPTGALTALFGLLTVRAAVVPRRWPSARPVAIGVGEVVATVALAAVLTLA